MRTGGLVQLEHFFHHGQELKEHPILIERCDIALPRTKNLLTAMPDQLGRHGKVQPRLQHLAVPFTALQRGAAQWQKRGLPHMAQHVGGQGFVQPRTQHCDLLQQTGIFGTVHHRLVHGHQKPLKRLQRKLDKSVLGGVLRHRGAAYGHALGQRGQGGMQWVGCRHLHPATALRQLPLHLARRLEAARNNTLFLCVLPQLVRVGCDAVQGIVKRRALQQGAHKGKTLGNSGGVFARVGLGVEHRRRTQLLQQIHAMRGDVAQHLLVVGLVVELARAHLQAGASQHRATGVPHHQRQLAGSQARAQHPTVRTPRHPAGQNHTLGVSVVLRQPQRVQITRQLIFIPHPFQQLRGGITIGKGLCSGHGDKRLQTRRLHRPAALHIHRQRTQYAAVGPHKVQRSGVSHGENPQPSTPGLTPRQSW